MKKPSLEASVAVLAPVSQPKPNKGRGLSPEEFEAKLAAEQAEKDAAKAARKAAKEKRNKQLASYRTNTVDHAALRERVQEEQRAANEATA